MVPAVGTLLGRLARVGDGEAAGDTAAAAASVWVVRGEEERGIPGGAARPVPTGDGDGDGGCVGDVIERANP